MYNQMKAKTHKIIIHSHICLFLLPSVLFITPCIHSAAKADISNHKYCSVYTIYIPPFTCRDEDFVSQVSGIILIGQPNE